MPRVLLFRAELLPFSETFIAAQASAMRCFEPWFAGLDRRTGGPDLEERRTLLLADGRSLRARLQRRAFLRFGRLCAGFGGAAFQRRICEINPVLLHAHFALDAAVALPIARTCGIPLIATLHGYDVTRSDEAIRRTPMGRAYLRSRAELWRECRLFLCVSEHIRKQAMAHGFPADKLWVHRIGVSLSNATSARSEGVEDREPTVLFVGRLVEKKGCAFLIRAMRMVQASIPGARLVLLGDGVMRGRLEKIAAEAGNHCSFLGAQSSSSVREWMGRASLLAAPSVVARDGDCEGLPTVICEAMAAGLPVVGFRGPGTAEAVDNGVTGLLVSAQDEAALAQAIVALLADKPLARRMGMAGRARAERKFDLLRQTALLEEKYNEVLRS